MNLTFFLSIIHTRSHRLKTTTHVDPRIRSQLTKQLEAELPFGWEADVDSDGVIYFIDHVHQTTQREPPWWESEVGSEEDGHRHGIQPAKARLVPADVGKPCTAVEPDRHDTGLHVHFVTTGTPCSKGGDVWAKQSGQHKIPPPFILKMPGQGAQNQAATKAFLSQGISSTSLVSDNGYASSRTSASPNFMCQSDPEDDGFEDELPPGWQQYYRNGRPYYTHNSSRRISWCDPRLALYYGVDLTQLPTCLDLDCDENGLYLIDHAARVTTRDLTPLQAYCPDSSLVSQASSPVGAYSDRESDTEESLISLSSMSGASSPISPFSSCSSSLSTTPRTHSDACFKSAENACGYCRPSDTQAASSVSQLSQRDLHASKTTGSFKSSQFPPQHLPSTAPVEKSKQTFRETVLGRVLGGLAMLGALCCPTTDTTAIDTPELIGITVISGDEVPVASEQVYHDDGEIV